jgi:Fusaric acid resistance protein-like
MTAQWYRDLYRIGSVTGVKAVVLRVALAVGVPLVGSVLLGHPDAGVAGGATALFVTMSDIGQTARGRLATMFAGWLMILLGGSLGHLLGDTANSREAVVLACALLAGWASGSHPGIAAVTRYFAVAAAAATGMRFADPDVLLCVVSGGVSAFAAAMLVWALFRLPPEDNVMDWRAGVRRAFHGTDAGPRYTLCYAAAAAVALFAASYLGVTHAFWATMVVLMVMRREGTASLDLTIHYAAGTIIGVALGAMVLRFTDSPVALAVLATAVAALGRVGFSVSPGLGYMAFTLFLLFLVQIVVASGGAGDPHLIEMRLYDVTVGCIIALAGTLAAIYPRCGAPRAIAAASAQPPPPRHKPP